MKKNISPLFFSIMLILTTLNLVSCGRTDMLGTIQTPDDLPVMVSEDFSDYADGTDIYTDGLFTGSGATVEGGVISIPTGAVIMSRQFRIPAIVEGTATIYPADYSSGTQQQNRFLVARDELYDSRNLPAVFSFDIVNNLSNTQIQTIVSIYESSGWGAPLLENTGFHFIDEEFNISSVVQQRFRIVLNNTFQEFYIYDSDSSEWVMVRREEFSLTSDVWWHFYMAGVNNNQDGTSYPHQLDSLTISAVESGSLISN